MKPYQNCSDCKPKTKCPFCDKNYKPVNPWHESRCVLNQPLWMVIPPDGIHLDCPVHPEGHHVFGSPITWMGAPIDPAKRGPQWNGTEPNLPNPYDKPWCEYAHDPSKDLTINSTKQFVDYDSTRIGSTTGTGFTGNDTNKFHM